MARKSRRSPDLAIRLSADERRKIDGAAAAEHLSSSTWLRRLALLAVEERRNREEQRKRMALLAARVRASDLPNAKAHAGELERARSKSWAR